MYDALLADQQLRSGLHEAMQEEARLAGHNLDLEETVYISAARTVLANAPIKGFESLTEDDFQNGVPVMFLHLALTDGQTFRGQQDKRIPTGFYVVRIITDFKEVRAQLFTPAGEFVSDVEAEMEHIPIPDDAVPEVLRTSASCKRILLHG